MIRTSSILILYTYSQFCRTYCHQSKCVTNNNPIFARYGAYSESEIYTTEEIKELIQYAQVRGIRVVIEIDAPAHAGNGWQWGKVN